MTTAEAWTPEPRTRPSSFLAVSMSSRTTWVGVVGLAQVGDVFEGLVDGDADGGGNELGDAVDVAVGHVEGAAAVLDGGLGGHGVEGDDLRDLLAAVLAGDVVDDLAAAVHAEVDVDIGHGDALGIEEALEEQLVLERIDVGDLHGVGDERAGGGAAAGADGDAVVAGVLDEVPDDEEVAGVLHLLDDVDFEVEAGFVLVRLDCGGRRAARAGGRRCRGACGGRRGRLLRSSCRWCGRRARRIRGRDCRLWLSLRLQRSAISMVRCEDGGRVLEDGGHLVGALDEELVAVEAEALGVVDLGAGLHAEHDVVGVVSLRRRGSGSRWWRRGGCRARVRGGRGLRGSSFPARGPGPEFRGRSCRGRRCPGTGRRWRVALS